MFELPFEQGPIRPVDEADSLLIRTTRGCPWNRCTFCSLYKEYKFSIRPVPEIIQDIQAARDYFEGYSFKTCFLQDGDSFVMKTQDLVQILIALKEAFPSLTRISSYGRAQTMAKKSPADIKEIHDAGLNKLYCGMESGSENVLKMVKKGITQESIIKSAAMAREAGMETTQFIIMGLGGEEYSREHALETAAVLNQINPDQIRLLTIGVRPGSALEAQINEGLVTLLSESRMIGEQRLMLENLNGVSSHYANHHAVDLLLEVRGQLPQDKPNLLGVLDRFLSMDESARNNFILGRRLGYYHRLSDMDEAARHDFVDRQLRKITGAGKGHDLESIFHDLRRQII